MRYLVGRTIIVNGYSISRYNGLRGIVTEQSGAFCTVEYFPSTSYEGYHPGSKSGGYLQDYLITTDQIWDSPIVSGEEVLR